VDTLVGETTSTKTVEGVYELIENLVLNTHFWGNPRPRAYIQGVHNVDIMVPLEAKVEAPSRKIEKLAIDPS
jgi:hypothetical protein